MHYCRESEYIIHPFADSQFENYGFHVTPLRVYDVAWGMDSGWGLHNVNNRQRERGK
jgi:hypothetical protein